MRYNRRNIDLDRLTAFKQNLRRRRNIDLDRLIAFRRNSPKQEIDLDRLSAFSRFKRSAIRNRDYVQPFLRRNPAPDGSAWGPHLYNPLEDDKHEFKDDSHYKKIASKLRRNPFRFNPEDDMDSDLSLLGYRSNPECSDCEETPCMCIKEYRYNPLTCDNCEQHICDCGKRPSRMMRRRSNPSNSCNDCGLRFGLHARVCSRRNW